MDVLDRNYAKKLVTGLQSGLDHATVDNTTCSITFYWKDGTNAKMTFPKPSNGVSVADIKLKKVTVGSDEETHLICLLDDGTEIDSGKIPGGGSEMSNTYFTTTSPITNKVGQFELNEEYTEADRITINEALNKILHVNINPEISLELVGSDTLLEIGQIISVANLRLVFTKTGSANITNIQFYKNNAALGASQSFIEGTTEYTNNTDRNISSDTTYKVVVNYNFGNGDKTLTKEKSVKFVKRSFYGTTQNDSFALNSDNIRLLSGSKLGIKKGDKFNININAGDSQVIIAYPKELGDISSVKYVEGMNAEIKDTFTKQVVQVKDLESTLTDYNVYVYKPINKYSKNATYAITI